MTRRELLVAVPAALAVFSSRPALAMIFDREQVRCATCHYWTGARKVYAQARVDTGYDERGRCNNMDSPYRNLYVGALHFCPAYLRWDQLD
jgi:hypothetical protein